MSTELSLRRDYLSQHRRLIIGRSLAASMSGMLPVPIVEEWMTSVIRRSTIKRIADNREVDADEDAIRAIADGPSSAPQWAEMVGTTLAFKLIARTWRKVIYTYVATKRAQAASRNFLIGTMFDHYCARLHVGLGLDSVAATELRSVMMRALDETSGGLGERVFRRGALAAARATVQAPVELLDIATGGAVRRLLTRGSKDDEVTAVEEVDQALEAQLTSKKSFLARAAIAVELQLSADANPYLDHLLENFEQLWRDRNERLNE